jgi:ABC-type multidrug transport system fused ATPase/permease subunit
MENGMTNASQFPELDRLFGAYFNQDFELWGDTIEEVVAAYKEGASRQRCAALRAEIEIFIEAHPSDLDSVFATRYGLDFDPAPRGIRRVRSWGG